MSTPMTAERYKSLAVRQIGDSVDGELSRSVDDYWDMHASKIAVGGLHLVFLLVKMELIEHLIGKYKHQVTHSTSGDLSVQLGERIKTLEAMGSRVSSEIKRRRGGGAIGQIETVAPVSSEEGVLDPVSPYADANDPAYSGSPYRRNRRDWTRRRQGG